MAKMLSVYPSAFVGQHTAPFTSAGGREMAEEEREGGRYGNGISQLPLHANCSPFPLIVI